MWIESQPLHKDRQQYTVIDAALGVIERGSYLVKDAVYAQPWLPDGPIPLEVEWSLRDASQRAHEMVTEAPKANGTEVRTTS